jgi:hypothetical protein
MFKRNDWKQRALEAEAALATGAQAAEELQGVLAKLHDRPVLINIDREGRRNRFTFIRNNQAYVIETVGTWDDDLATWKKDLLQ